MSASDESFQAVTKLLCGQNVKLLNTNDTVNQFFIVHRPDPADHSKVTVSVVKKEQNKANSEYGQSTMESGQVFADSIGDEVNNDNDANEILYEAVPINVNTEKSNTSLWKYGQGYKQMTRKHQCKVCKKLYFSPWQLKRHEAVHMKTKPFTCSTCNKSFIQYQSLQYHQSTHTGIWKFTCSTCNVNFNTKQLYCIHLLKYKHGDYESIPRHDYFTKCKICGKDITKRSVYKHMQAHSNEEEREKRKIYKCHKCGHRTDARYKLMYHLAIHSEERPHRCPDCNRSFKLWRSVRQHKRWCNKNEVKRCTVCGAEFSNSRWLKKHIEKHHNESSEKLPKEKANKSDTATSIFGQPPDDQQLEATAFIENKPKTFQTCGICSKQFAKMTFMQVHMRKHSSTGVCSCQNCNTWFTELSELNDHTC